MADAYICDFVRTPIGRYGGVLKDVRTDDLAAHPMRVLKQRNAVGRLGSARRRDLRLRQPGGRGQPQRRAHGGAAGRPAGPRVRRHDQPPVRLGPRRGRHRGARHPGRRRRADDRRRRREHDARAVRDGQGDRGVRRARRDLRHHDRLALRQPADEGAIRRGFHAGDGGERGRGLPGDRAPTRTRSPARSQMRAKAAQESGFFAREIAPVAIEGRKGTITVDRDEHPRGDTTLEGLAKLRTPFRKHGGTVTAGNASGVNDGAAALIIASEQAAKRHGLTPRARVVAMATAGVPPRIMGIGPAPATQKLLERLGLKIGEIDVIELNEAFAGARPGGDAPARAAGRCRAREPAWRRDRARPSAGHVGCAAGADRGERARDARRQAGHRDDVHRRRAGHRRADRTGLEKIHGASGLCANGRACPGHPLQQSVATGWPARGRP